MTSAIHDQEWPFTLTVGGAALDETLSSRAWGVYVDNYTGRWVSLPGIGTFVPPLTSRTLALPGVTKAQARFEAPGSQAQPAGTVGDVCLLRFTERLVQPSGGLVGQPGVQAADVFVMAATFATLPVFGIVGRLGYVTGTGTFYRDTGLAWQALPIGQGSFPTGYTQLTNNFNAVTARDFLGNIVNMLLLDADPPAGNLLIGPTDPRIGIIFDAFTHAMRHRIFYDFDGAALPAEISQTFIGAGSFAIPGGRSQVESRSAALAAGDGVQLTIMGWNWQRANGERSLWWLTMEDALNQEHCLGYESTAGPALDFVRFRITELGAQGTWQAECSAGGIVTTASTGVLRDGTRRWFMIDTLGAVAGFVDFYIDGVLTNSINTNIPVAGDIQPFDRQISNGAAVNRRSLLDTWELGNNR